MTPLFSDDSPANQLDPDVIRMYRRVALSIAWVTLVISLFNLLGWLIDSSLVAGIFLGLPPMRAITTSAFLIVALALLGAARTTPRRLPLGLYAGLALIGLGLASLAEHHGWFDFGFSRWTLSTANGPIEASMPWITSLVFMLFGMRILAFCDALIAKKMVEYNIIFAGFLPCRIAVLEDSNGKGWIVTQNMDMMLHAVDLPEDLQPLAKKVRDTIYSIVDAGVNGDL